MKKKSLIVCSLLVLLFFSSCFPEPTIFPTLTPVIKVTSTQVQNQTEIPQWHTEKYLTCERVNVSMLNEAGKKLEIKKIMKNSLGEEIAKDDAEVDPGGYANLGWNPQPGYFGNISWLIQIIEPGSEIVKAQFEDTAELDCRATPTP